MNKVIFEFIFSLSHQNSAVDGFIVFLATYLPYALALGFLFIVLAHAKEWRKRVALLGGAGISIIVSRGILVELIRFFYEHPRPFAALQIEPVLRTIDSPLNSFPSGHAAIFFALAAMLFYFDRRWSGWYFALALINGFARIAAGVHWPYDIIAGAAVGIVSGIISYRLIEPYLKKLDARTSH